MKPSQTQLALPAPVPSTVAFQRVPGGRIRTATVRRVRPDGVLDVMAGGRFMFLAPERVVAR